MFFLTAPPDVAAISPTKMDTDGGGLDPMKNHHEITTRYLNMGFTRYIRYPHAPCMEYLLTFTLKITQM